MTKRISNGMNKKISFSLAIVCIGFLIGFYVFQVNSLAALAYHVAQTEENLTQLKQEHAALQTKVYQAPALENLAELAAARNFEKITFMGYLRQPAGPVAQNQP